MSDAPGFETVPAPTLEAWLEAYGDWRREREALFGLAAVCANGEAVSDSDADGLDLLTYAAEVIRNVLAEDAATDDGPYIGSFGDAADDDDELTIGSIQDDDEDEDTEARCDDCGESYSMFGDGESIGDRDLCPSCADRAAAAEELADEVTS